MRKSLVVSLFALVIAAMVLSACGTATPAATEAPTTAPAATEAPTAEPTLAPGSVQINGAGATFPLPVYTAWTYAYQYVDPSVVINYQGIGSGGGKKGIIDNTIDFAGSDSLLKDEEYTSGKDLQMYPMLAGAVVPVYNLTWAKEFAADAKVPALVLDRQTLVDIYNAKITKWNDPAIVALNPGLDGYLPDATITAVHRSDGSGTTEIFTKALASFSADWTAGGASSVEWPVDKAGNGIGGKGNQGVAAAVINTPNSIGYVELSYAISNKMAAASLVNKAGKTVVANAESVAADMSDFATAFDAKLTATIVDGAGEGSWPITGYTYIILHTTDSTDAVKTQKIVEFLKWALTDAGASSQAASLGYSVLPEAVRDQVLAKLAEVSVNGVAVLK
ncbi:MAG: phosphate ABC transporter substrate-binding protein PstS [Anaerolineaceae bacterium]|nr:phosphate ABC transporter substrate-binding protein PstS [Anaerolineaceae bacterium]